MATAVYSIGSGATVYTVAAQTPALIYQSTGPSDFAWFSGIHNFFGRGYLVRFSDTPDATDASAHHKHIVSTDGVTWGPSYRVRGVHTSCEPLVMVAGSDTLTGAVTANGFTRGPAVLPGLMVGGSYTTVVQPGLRSLRSQYVEIRGGGLDYFMRDAGTLITGFTRDISAGYWFGSIVQLAANNWVSVMQMQYVGDGGLFTCECVKSTDLGKSWARIGTVATTAIGGEGMSEPDIISVPATGELMVVSRVGSNGGTTKCARSFSTDGGVTWGAATRIPPYMKAPHLFQLANGDFICTSGGSTNAAPDTSITGLGMWFETDPHGTWTNVWDMLAHHNAMITDPNQQFPTGAPPAGCRGYTGICQVTALSNGSALKISYERAGADIGDGTPNRIYVVDVTITR